MGNAFLESVKIIFEPLAVLAALGFLLALLRRDKDRKALVICGVFLLLLFALRIGWRITSARYAFLLVVPTLYLVGYCCLALGEEFAQRIRKFSGKGRLLGGLFLLIVSGVLLGKDLRQNPYADRAKNCGTYIRNHSHPAEALLVVSGSEGNRIAYYAGMENVRWLPQTDFFQKDLSARQRLVNEVKAYQVLRKPFFLAAIQNTSEPRLRAGELGLSEGDWQCCFEEFTGKKRNKVLRLYYCRFSPLWENIILPNPVLPQVPEESSTLLVAENWKLAAPRAKSDMVPGPENGATLVLPDGEEQVWEYRKLFPAGSYELEFTCDDCTSGEILIWTSRYDAEGKRYSNQPQAYWRCDPEDDCSRTIRIPIIVTRGQGDVRVFKLFITHHDGTMQLKNLRLRFLSSRKAE